MNRRAFLKLIGVSVVAAGLPMPKTPVRTEFGGPYPHCECETCKTGLPATSIHWKILEPRVVLLNDLPITIALTGA